MALDGLIQQALLVLWQTRTVPSPSCQQHQNLFKIPLQFIVSHPTYYCLQTPTVSRKYRNPKCWQTAQTSPILQSGSKWDNRPLPPSLSTCDGCCELYLKAFGWAWEQSRNSDQRKFRMHNILYIVSFMCVRVRACFFNLSRHCLLFPYALVCLLRKQTHVVSGSSQMKVQ